MPFTEHKCSLSGTHYPIIGPHSEPDKSILHGFDIFPTRYNFTQFISGKLLYMFRVVSSPIIRSTYNCIYSIWYLL